MFFALWRRELASFFLSPIAYFMAIFFLIVEGFSFWYLASALAMGSSEVTVMSQFFGTVFFWIPFLFVVPVLTMRLFAEEKRTQTIEMLLTAPVTDLQVVVAKYLGVFSFYICMWLPTLSYAYILRVFSSETAPIDFGPMLGGYLAAFLIGMFYLSVGLFCSALTREQIVAAIMCFAVMFVMFFVGLLHPYVQSDAVKEVCTYGSPFIHMLDFSRGAVDTRPIVFYVSGTILVLFFVHQALETRKW